MKIQELKTTDASNIKPCELVSNYLIAERNGMTFKKWIAQFEYQNEREIEKAIKEFTYAITADIYMSNKRNATDDPFSFVIYKRFFKLATDISRFDKFANVTAHEIWNGGYRQQQIKQNFDNLMAEPATQTFDEVSCKLQQIYGLTPIEIEKIRFFVAQTKAREKFPNSLRRMLYIWGDTKMTGKTTCANTIAAILNGYTNISNAADFTTTLTNEMQIKSFAVPRISITTCCVMDECFYADMGKTYADFKRFLTSSDGRARLPYGQEFEWHGVPNYIATSNDPLRKFIKDWNDRRYLSVEFRNKPTQDLTFSQIYDLWLDFVKLTEEPDDWKVWADAIFDAAEEMGERTEIANEFIVELQSDYFVEYLESRRTGGANDKITLKVFVDYFARDIGNIEAHKRKNEIEKAVLSVFGDRYSTTNYWRLPALKETLNKLKEQNTRSIDIVDLDDALSFPF